MWSYFELSEFDCSETGENKMVLGFVSLLDELRGRCGFPFNVTSGYRSPQHSKEVIKDEPGMHTKGKAADIAVTNAHQRYTIVKEAVAMGFTGIGPAGVYVHLDLRDGDPVMWVY
jgi:uncharacterized protein YcbK (DUF882 family)